MVKLLEVHRHRMEESRKKQILDILSGPYFGIEKVSEESLTLYDIALTHSSFAEDMRKKNVPCENFERLEFFGNYLLAYAVAGYLNDSTNYEPGEMSVRLQVTANPNLAKVVKKQDLKIKEAILLGEGTALTDNIIADAFEAFIGAIKYAEGTEKACKVILGIFADEIKSFNPDSNYKGRLQEYVAQKKLGNLKYKHVEEGPAHKKIHTAIVYLNGNMIGQGTAYKQSVAEMHAAREALQKLNIE